MATDQKGDTTVNLEDTIVNQEDMATDQKVDTIVNQEDMATDQKVDTTAGQAMVNQGRMDMVAAEEASKAIKVAEEVFRIEKGAGEEVSNVRTLARGVLALQQVLQEEPLGHQDMTGKSPGVLGWILVEEVDIIPGALPLPQQVVMIGVVHPLHDKEVAVLSIKSVVKIQLTEDFPGISWRLLALWCLPRTCCNVEYWRWISREGAGCTASSEGRTWSFRRPGLRGSSSPPGCLRAPG